MWRFISPYTLLHIYIINFVKIIQKKVPEVYQTTTSQLVQMENSKHIDNHVHSMCFPLCLLQQGFVYLLAAIILYESYLEMCHHKRQKMCVQECLVPFVQIILMDISTEIFPFSSRKSSNLRKSNGFISEALKILYWMSFLLIHSC